mmetsp:Transcript_27763/g.49627  ORF Transcript_27763/g.49627 Transcript_27763/m.49627 type:complete len:94 (-) Transcript_27763:178-459(-)
MRLLAPFPVQLSRTRWAQLETFKSSFVMCQRLANVEPLAGAVLTEPIRDCGLEAALALVRVFLCVSVEVGMRRAFVHLADEGCCSNEELRTSD